MQFALCFDEDTIGALMDYDMVSVRDAVTLEAGLPYLRSWGQLHATGTRKLIFKELGVAGLNGLIWSSVMELDRLSALQKYFSGPGNYQRDDLKLIRWRQWWAYSSRCFWRRARDPAVGSSALITVITDRGGLFIFLGLATLFLL